VERATRPVRGRGRSHASAEAPLLTRLNARGFRLLMVADTAVLIGVMVLTMVARFGFTWPDYPLRHYAVGFAAAAALHLGVYYLGGLYERELRIGNRPQLPRITMLTLVAVLFDGAAALLTATPDAPGRYLMPRANLAVLFVLGSMGLAANRRIARWLRRQREGPARVLLVGAPDDANLARSHLDGDGSRTATVVGVMTSSRRLLIEVEQRGATEVLLVSGGLLDELYPEPLQTLEDRGVSVLQRISAKDTLLGLKGVREIGGMPFVPLRTHTLPVSQARFKRMLELLGLVLTAPLTLPLILFTAVYVRMVAGAPVLFWQERVGREGAVFRMVKFRTMYPHAEEGIGPVLAARGDPRVIPACQWLRSTRLDELPQLWNVLRGEMSIIGPRPERPELTAQFEALIPGYTRRHEIPPGITGLAQIHGRYHTDPEYKLGHDLQYLVNWSPVLDLQILVRTVWVVLARRV
jgi:exopolysaccharide biosynthesis polyprenyl glycosylphosphotransferase